ncbi:hypothetical protein D3C75_1021340 [compost metagenome]
MQNFCCAVQRGTDQDFFRIEQINHDRQNAAHAVPHPEDNVFRQLVTRQRRITQRLDRQRCTVQTGTH